MRSPARTVHPTLPSRPAGRFRATAAVLALAVLAVSGCGASALLVSDFTVHASALSAATVLSRADVCRRLTVG